MTAQSPGVPVIPKRRAPRSLTRIGWCRLTACETPLWSCSGATTHTSRASSMAIRSRTSRPGASMPSSLVIRMRSSTVRLQNAVSDPIPQQSHTSAGIMAATGPRNLITDVPGILVGQAEDRDGITGTTVVLAEQPAMASVDVRGGAPGSRETELLAPETLVDRVD